MKFWMLKFGYFGLLLFACQPKEKAPVNYKNILVLGNSITYHPPDPSIGWNGAWGMAATASSKDFFYLGINQMYMATGQFENEQVVRHPNDLGMQAISKSLAKKILSP
jgi:hypothetical protein